MFVFVFFILYCILFMLVAGFFFFFFFNDTATTEIYTLSYTTLFRSAPAAPAAADVPPSPAAPPDSQSPPAHPASPPSPAPALVQSSPTHPGTGLWGRPEPASLQLTIKTAQATATTNERIEDPPEGTRDSIYRTLASREIAGQNAAETVRACRASHALRRFNPQELEPRRQG